MREVREFTFNIVPPPSLDGKSPEELIGEALNNFLKGVLEAGVVAKYGREAMKEAVKQIEERDRKAANKQ